MDTSNLFDPAWLEGLNDVTAIVLIVIGVFFAFVGHKIFKVMLILVTSVGCGYVGMTLVISQSLQIIAGVSIAAAVVSGVLLWYFFSTLALPLLGMLDGVLLCSVLMHVLPGWQIMVQWQPWSPVLAFVGAGFVFGIPSLCFRKNRVLTVYTALLGSWAFGAGLARYLKTSIGTQEIMQGGWHGEKCDDKCLYLSIGCGALFLVGMIAQAMMGGCKGDKPDEYSGLNVIEVQNPVNTNEPLVDAPTHSDTPLAAKIRRKYGIQ